MTLLDASTITQELVSDEFLLQQQASQQITRELDEAQDIEFERNWLIQEDCEAREVEQHRQAELAQYRMFRRFIASQEVVEQSASDSSNDTLQDGIPPTSSMEGDSRPVLAMNISARTQPATVTHTNCVLCRQPPNITGHRIEDYPIIMQHGLRFQIRW